jgi:hypothetical protein
MKKLNYRLFTMASIFILTGCGGENAAVTCTKTFGENDKHVFKYSFEDGKAYLLDWAGTIPATDIADATIYEKEFNKINDVTGCTGKFTKNDDSSYTIQQVCDFNEMSDSDIQAVFMNSREDLENTRKEILKHYESDEGMKCE